MAEDDLEDDLEDDELDEEDGDDSGGASSGGKKKLLIIVGAVFLLLIGGGAAAYFTGLLDPLLGDSEEASAEGVAGGEGAAVFLDLDEMIVNLNTSGRRQTLLKIKVALELASQADLVTIQTVMPRVVDNFQTYLRELRVDDLSGSAGLYRLREELLTRVNVAVQPAKVNAILFKEMLIQ
ncbi:MAG: flagellar basal body-associated FliL family protein [Rhodospirillales bacterium]|nr:flagellar basal body-associated FliL family protein [Rhodospirillales bacterium]